jgi:hypothetical protein
MNDTATQLLSFELYNPQSWIHIESSIDWVSIMIGLALNNPGAFLIRRQM